jgi:hypothetical protein
MEVLEKDSCLVRSDAIAINITDATTKKLKTIAARDGVKLPKPKVGKLREARLYLEYSF